MCRTSLITWLTERPMMKESKMNMKCTGHLWYLANKANRDFEALDYLIIYRISLKTRLTELSYQLDPAVNHKGYQSWWMGYLLGTLGAEWGEKAAEMWWGVCRDDPNPSPRPWLHPPPPPLTRVVGGGEPLHGLEGWGCQRTLLPAGHLGFFASPASPRTRQMSTNPWLIDLLVSDF